MKATTRVFAAPTVAFYIDEVNLLDDSLVDVVLDSAAGGWNTVEREGIHRPRKFIMIGSGNPRRANCAQLLDRPHRVHHPHHLRQGATRGAGEEPHRLRERSRGVHRVPEGGDGRAQGEDSRREKILPEVTMDRDRRSRSLAWRLVDVDGLRGDIVVTRAAKALVAYEGRTEVTEADIERVIGPCLSHRFAGSPGHHGRLLQGAAGLQQGVQGLRA